MVLVQGLAAFDGMAVIAALPSIAADLGNVSLLPWVSTAYLGTSAVAVLIGGPVIDAIGAGAEAAGHDGIIWQGTRQLGDYELR